MKPRTAIVTGASRGIGRAIALALGGADWRVVINYNSNAAAAEEAAKLVKASGRGDAHIVQGDIGNCSDHAALIDAAYDRFGSLHLLVNNAGVAPKVRADLLEVGQESWDYILDTNLRGPFFLSQLAANRMIAANASASGGGVASGGGAIVNISSISAYTASVNRGEYCIAKAGISMMTQLFAARLAQHGINVYEIRPGIIETDMTGPVKAKYDKLILEDGLTPIRRWGQPQDVAKAVLAVAEGRFAFSTGEVINVDGGFHLRTL